MAHHAQPQPLGGCRQAGAASQLDAQLRDGRNRDPAHRGARLFGARLQPPTLAHAAARAAGQAQAQAGAGMKRPSKSLQTVETVDGRIYWSDDNWETVWSQLGKGRRSVKP